MAAMLQAGNGGRRVRERQARRARICHPRTAIVRRATRGAHRSTRGPARFRRGGGARCGRGRSRISRGRNRPGEPRLARSDRRALSHRPPLHRARRSVPAPRDDGRRHHSASRRRGARPRVRTGVARPRRPGSGKRTGAQRRLPRPGRRDGGVPRGLRGDDPLRGVPRGVQCRRACRAHGRASGRRVAAPPAGAGLDCRARSPSRRPSSFSPGRAWWCRTPSS